MSATSSHETHRTLEEIAYQSWLNRGCPVGSPEVDWDHACRIVGSQITRVESAPLQPGADPTFKELGSDEDTPSDPQSVSPFEAAADNSPSATPAPNQSKPVKPSTAAIGKGKRSKSAQQS